MRSWRKSNRSWPSSSTTRAITYVRSHEEFIERSYRADSRMVAFLSVLVGLMISVTALGIVGLASFHVNVRTKQIGTRRAVGARRIDIIRYFMVENWLLTTGGVVDGRSAGIRFRPVVELGSIRCRACRRSYVAGGVVVLWILGQLAVFLPARRRRQFRRRCATSNGM